MKKIIQLPLWASVAYLVSKYLLMEGSSYGFLIATFGALLTAIKFYKDKLYWLSLNEIAIIPLNLIFFVYWENLATSTSFKADISAISLIAIWLIFTKAIFTLFPLKDLMKSLEDLALLFFVLGGYLIVIKETNGWAFFIIAHFCVAVIQAQKKDSIFFTFQIISMILSFWALI